MFVIREEQIRRIEEANRLRFEEEVTAHVTKFFPEEVEELGEAKLRRLIGYGIVKAKSYEIARECDVTAFISLMVALGSSFDHDKENKWMRAILENDSLDPDAKMPMLYEELARRPDDEDEAAEAVAVPADDEDTADA